MTLTKYPQFTGLLSLGLNLDGGAPSATTDAERELLDTYIEVYEWEYLRSMLGDEVANEFMEWVSSTNPEMDGEGEGPDEDVSSMKWKPLYDLIVRKYSPVACYIFFKYVQTGNFSVCRTGTLTSADDDAVSPDILLVRVWNEMVRRNRQIHSLLCCGYEGAKTEPFMLGMINVMGI